MKKTKQEFLQPHRLAALLLRHMFPDKEELTSLGDFEEAFREIAAEQGAPKAHLWYWLQIILSFKALVFGKIYWSIVMIKNYIKIAYRNFKRQKVYTFINMFGLTAGIATCLVIFLFVTHELSYDKHHKDLDRIYRVAVRSESPTYNSDSATICAPVAQVLRDNFPEVEEVAQAFRVQAGLMERDEIKFYEDTRIFADNEIFKILTIPFLQGNPQTALTRPYTMVISDRISKKYFGDMEPLGQILQLKEIDYQVTGVVADPPENTHFKYDIFLSMTTLKDRYPFDRWFISNFYIYIKVKPQIHMASLEEKVAKIALNYAPKEQMLENETITYFLQPVGGIHLHSHLRSESEPGLNPLYLYIFTAIGIFVLLIACINFINLSTARSTQRAKEVGIRKVIGARRSQLIRQFYGESTVIILAALVFALLLVGGILPYLNSFLGKSFSVTSLIQPQVLVFLLLLVSFIGLAASGYPALLLSAFQPSRVFKINLPIRGRGSNLRKTLVVGQFALSIALIAGTLVVYQQLHFMKNQNLGLELEQKLILPVRGPLDIEDNYETIKAKYLQYPSILGASVSSEVPGQKLSRWNTQAVGEGIEDEPVLNHIYIGPDFIKEYGIKMIAGRDFNRDVSTDIKEAYILNRAAAAEYGWTPEEAIGKKLQSIFDPCVVIGVTEDFHYQGLQTVIEPLTMIWRPDSLYYITLRINTQKLPETMATVKQEWAAFFPGFPFDYFFLDSTFEQEYQSENKISRMFTAFTALGVIIACLGLLGLASYTAEQKTKEIGIRKVLGASTREIVLLLTREFIKWVAIANVIAWPVTYLVMSRWLTNFTYRIQIGLGVLLAAAALALIIALATVSVQSFRAAAADPVKALKYE